MRLMERLFDFVGNQDDCHTARSQIIRTRRTVASEDVVRVQVEILAGPVVTHVRAGVGAACGELGRRGGRLLRRALW